MNRIDLLEDTREHIYGAVEAGFDSREDIISMAMGYMSDDPDNAYPPVVLRRVATRLTDALLAKHEQAQQGWAYPTDCDRLEEALEALARQGIYLYRPRHGQPGSEQRQQARQAVAQQPGAVGYIIVQRHDTTLALTTGTLCLDFGALDGTEESHRTIGYRLLHLLRLVGLHATWDGTPGQRLQIHGMDWKRRRAG
ncbi:MAG: hypothetical protein MUE40_02000 [Anaerolineae bacterium]|jgi:hypothetical protein|nr:hypothetical protein [Anaerolineae bacterium]